MRFFLWMKLMKKEGALKNGRKANQKWHLSTAPKNLPDTKLKP